MKIKSCSSNKYYQLDIENETCSCDAFKNAKHCKHLDSVGVYKNKKWSQTAHPTFSQALSGMVKSIRLRRVQDAIYWLVYCDSLQKVETGARFRLARRTLIAAAEDGVSIPVMEVVDANYRGRMLDKSADIILFAAEIQRICGTPNWWDSSTGGHEYLQSCLVASRNNMYGDSNHLSDSALLAQMDSDDPQVVMTAFDALCGRTTIGKTVLANKVLGMAEHRNSEEGKRVVGVHLNNRSALSGDANFIGQALWWVIGGGFNNQTIATVEAEPLYDMIHKAHMDWKTPKRIPEWCCDGIHCGGTDRRFAGMLNDMVACTQVFNYYGDVTPDLKWRREFYLLDGLRYE